MDLLQIHFETDQSRSQWSHKREYVLSCIGGVIGFSNLLRFPYLCYKNGGGAFLIAYLLMLPLYGVPLFYLEATLGQFSSGSCLTVFKISPLFKGVGYTILIVNYIYTCYHAVIVSYTTSYIYESLVYKLPWINCDNAWNTNECLEFNGGSASKRELNESLVHRTPSEEFFYNKILQQSTNLEDPFKINWSLFIINCITFLIIFLCILRGIHSISKVIYSFVILPVAILIVLFLRCITLPGALDGICYYLNPDWDKLIHYQVWLDASVQTCFVVGGGWGGVVNMASYNRFHNNHKTEAFLVPICNAIITILAGFVVFSLLGVASQTTGLPIAEIATGGQLRLAFVICPEEIVDLPFAPLWSVLFYLLLCLLSLASCVVTLESMITALIDEYKRLRLHRKAVRIGVCFLICISSMMFMTNTGAHYIQLFDFHEWWWRSWVAVIVCGCELFIVGCTYGMKNFVRDLEFMKRTELHWWWLLCWRFTTHVILMFIIIATITNSNITPNNTASPDSSITPSWPTAFIPIFSIPYYMGYKLLYKSEGDLFERISLSVQAGKKWGPKQTPHREEWLYLVYKKRVIKMSHLLERTKDDRQHQNFLSLSTDNFNTSHL